MKQINLRHKASHILVTGRSSTGKSTFVEQYILRESKQNKVFIFDPEGEFAGRFIPQKVGTYYVAGNLEMAGQDNLPRIVIYTVADNSDWHLAFSDFCFFCFQYANKSDGTVLMVVDELQRYVSPDDLPPEFKDAIERGRRYGLDMLYISQQPNLLHNIVRTQTTEAVAFAQSDEVAVKYNKNLGFSSEEIMSLPDLTYLRKQLGHPPKKFQISFDKPSPSA